MNNIFEGAKLGDKYSTIDGKYVVYIRSFICNGNKHLVSNGRIEYMVDDLGRVNYNIYPNYCKEIVM